jgi:hypothetical protein
MKLPSNAETVQTMTATVEAREMLEKLLHRKQELENIFVEIQPLLLALSIKLYGTDDRQVMLADLINDGIKYLNVEDVQVKELQ